MLHASLAAMVNSCVYLQVWNESSPAIVSKFSVKLNIGSQLNQYTKQQAREAWLLSCCQSILFPLFAVRRASPLVSKVSHIPAFVGLPHIDHWPLMRPTEFPCISSQ